MKRSIKIPLIILLSIAVIILIFNFLFGYLIKTQIKNFSNESVTLDYKSSKARLLIGSIEFREAVLLFNDVSIDSSSSIFIESVSFETFAINHLSLKALLFERSFNIEKVLLSGPSIDFLKDTSISPKDIFSKVLTPKVVSTKSQAAPFSFEIGEVEIDQGSIILLENERSDFSLGSINLKLTNIGMEDLKVLNRDAPDLNANFDIQLSIYDFQKELKGKAEALIDSIIYKKDKKLFEIGGIQLNNLSSSTAFAKSEISLITDLISIRGFSLSHFLSSRDVKFNRFTISNIEVHERFNYLDNKKTGDDTSNSKGQLLTNVINAFITDSLQIQNFNYQAKNVITDSIDYINNLNISLYSVKVDSNFILEKEYLSTLEQSNVQSGSICLHMKEFGIDFLCDSLVYSGPGKEQKILGLNLNTYPALFSNNSDQPGIQFDTDSLVIWGLEEREWADSAIVEFSMHLENPTVSGSNIFLGKSEKKKPPAFIPNKIILNNLNLVNGSINIEGSLDEIIKTESLNINLVDLEINPKEKQGGQKVFWQNIFTTAENSKFLIPDQLIIRLDQAVINEDNFDFKGIFYSENHIIGNQQNSNPKQADTTRFFVERIQLDNFDVKALINQKHLIIDKFEISRPEYFQFTALKRKQSSKADTLTPLLLYKRINKALPDFFTYIDVKDFSIAEADISYNLKPNNIEYHSFASAYFHKIKFDKNQAVVGFPELIIDNYEFCITDVDMVSNKIKLNTESVCYNSTDDEIIFLNSNMDNTSHHLLNTNEGSMKFNFNFPNITLTKPNFTPISGGPISFNIIHIIEPDINLHLPSQKEKLEKISTSDFKVLPFTYIENGVNLENGNATISTVMEDDSTIVNIGQINLNMHDIYKIIGAADYHSPDKNVFSYLDFYLKDISMTGPGLKSSVQDIKYDNESKTISIWPVKQEIFSKANAPEFNGTINIPNMNIEYPDLMLVDEKIESFGARNLLIPTVNVEYEARKKEDPEEEKGQVKIAKNDSTLRNFLGNVDFFHIDSTFLNNIGITYHEFTDTSRSTVDIERVSFLVDKLKIDSSHFDFHKKRIAKDIVIQLHDKELISGDSMYSIKINNVAYYYSRDKVIIDSFEVKPRYDRKEFFERAGFQTDRMQVKFSSAIMEGIDLLSILESKKLQVRKVTLDEFKLQDHRDQHYPRKENDFKLLPKQSLYNLPFVLNIDTIQANNSFLLYGEYVDKSPDPGEIYFTDLNASIFNVSNIDNSEKDHNLHAHMSSLIMDKAKMDLDLTIPLSTEIDSFWFSANVERADLTYLNSMTQNLFGVSILRGKGEVNIPLIAANNFSSKGTIDFQYKRLKLAMYNRNKAKLQQGLGSGLVSFLLNGVLIKSNNPTFLGKPRTGDVYTERNNQRSFFNYLWKSTMSGLMATMGFYNKQMREEKRERKEEEKIERKDGVQTSK